MMSLPRFSLLLGALLTGLGLTRSARADGDLEALLSTPIESTAGKSAGTSDSAPALSLSVTAEDLRRYGIRTLAEAYNFLTTGLDSEDPLGDPEVGSRGVLFTEDRGKHVLLLLDGHTLNDQENGESVHGYGFGLPMEMIDHVEIVLGPGSVLYGANAMFGVINVITKRAKDIKGVQLVAEAAVSPPLDRAHSPLGPGAISPYLANLGQAYRLAATAGHEFNWGSTPAELTAAFEYYTLSGPTMTWGPQSVPVASFGPRDPIGSWGGQTKDSYYERTPSGFVRLVAGEFDASLHVVASRVSAPFQRRDSAPSDYPDFDDPDAYRDRFNANLELKWRHDVSEVTSVMARIYADATTNSSRIHQTVFSGCFAPFRIRAYERCSTTDSGYARWIGSEVQGSFDWTRNAAFVTMVGLDGRVRQVGYENGFSAVDTGQHQQYSKLERFEQGAAAYAEQVYRATKELTLNAGARWDFDSNFGNRISPRGALIVDPWRGGTLKAIYAEAHRAPTLDEQTYRDPTLALPSQHLDPESVRSVEAILQQRFGTQSLVFGIFRSWWRNMIVRHDLENSLLATSGDANIIHQAQANGLLATNVRTVFQYQNVGSLENFGFNAGYDGNLVSGRLAYGLNLTSAYARSSTAEGTRLITVTPSWFGNARISYDLSNRLPVVALATHFSGKRLADAGEDAHFPTLPYAPAVLDLRATVSGPFPAVERLSYRLMGDYSLAATSPYSAGPAKSAYERLPAELIPANRITVMLGLQYNLFQ
jgi:outer membrane receptor for ferrienterochelin and colicins